MARYAGGRQSTRQNPKTEHITDVSRRAEHGSGCSTRRIALRRARSRDFCRLAHDNHSHRLSRLSVAGDLNEGARHRHQRVLAVHPMRGGVERFATAPSVRASARHRQQWQRHHSVGVGDAPPCESQVKEAARGGSSGVA